MQPPCNIQKGQRGAKPHSKTCLPSELPVYKQEMTESPPSANGEMDRKYDNIPATVDHIANNPFNSPSMVHRPIPVHSLMDKSPVKSEIPNFRDFEPLPSNDKFRLSPSSNNREVNGTNMGNNDIPSFPQSPISAHSHGISVKTEPETEEAQDFTMMTLKRKERMSQDSEFGSSSSPVQNNEVRLPLLLDFRKEHSPVS